MGCGSSEERQQKPYTDACTWFRKDADGTKGVDCFYLHPTTEMGLFSVEMGQMTYAKKKLTGMGAGTPDLMDTQAKCMEETCNLWVPRYNQLGMLSQAIPKPGLAEKKEKQFMEHMEHTVTCVEEAFTYFLENRPDKTRPFVIFGHSQGSIMMTRAIKDHLAGTEHQKYFIAAYLAAPAQAWRMCQIVMTRTWGKWRKFRWSHARG